MVQEKGDCGAAPGILSPASSFACSAASIIYIAGATNRVNRVPIGDNSVRIVFS